MKFLFPLSNLRTLLSLVLEKNMQNYIQNSKLTETFCQEMIFFDGKKQTAEERLIHSFSC